MLNLFADSAIPGLHMQAEFVTTDEEQALIADLEAQALEPFRFQQWTGKRLAKSFGLHYDFQTGSVSRAEALPHWLLPLRDRVRISRRWIRPRSTRRYC